MDLIDSEVRGLFADLYTLRDRIQLTSGYVEAIRLTMTELAVRGHFRGSAKPIRTSPDLLRQLQSRTSKQMPPSYGPPFAIPLHWEWFQLGQIADFSIGKTPPTKDAKYWAQPGDDGATHFISISDMPRRGLVETTDRAISVAGVTDDLRREPIAEGTLLMAFKLSVGKTAIVGLESAFFNEAIAAIDIEDDSLKQYLLWVLPTMATYGSKNPTVRGSTLNKKSIQTLWVPIPPEHEQREIVSSLVLLTGLLEQYAASHERARDSAGSAFKLLRSKATTLGIER